MFVVLVPMSIIKKKEFKYLYYARRYRNGWLILGGTLCRRVFKLYNNFKVSPTRNTFYFRTFK